MGLIHQREKTCQTLKVSGVSVCVSELSRCTKKLYCMYECRCCFLTADEAALKRHCWIPFDIKTISIRAQGGILCFEPQSDHLQETKEDTIFVEVPPDAVSTSANVEMRYAIIPSGSFTLPEGYQFGSPVVYIYYDGRRVTKPLVLHLPHWYGGEDSAKDGLSFAVAPHSLKGGGVYHFQLLAGGKFTDSSHYRVIEISGHCSLFTKVFKLGATVNCQAVCLEKEEGHETVCDIAVTYASPYWRQVRFLKNFSSLLIQNVNCAFVIIPCRSWRSTGLVGS